MGVIKKRKSNDNYIFIFNYFYKLILKQVDG